MTNVFEGQPDARQADSQQAYVSRFRPRYRALSDAEKALHDELKDAAAHLETLFKRVQDDTASRYKSLAITALEESIMWIVKDLTDVQRQAPSGV